MDLLTILENYIPALNFGRIPSFVDQRKKELKFIFCLGEDQQN